MINIYQPSVGKEELDAINDVFKSNWLGRGKLTVQFKQDFAKSLVQDEYHGVAFAPPSVENFEAINSCTEGLFQSMEVLGLKEGDQVILPSISFIGAVNAIVNSRATPVFCDVDVRTLNTTAEYIKDKITSNTKAVILLHYAGVPCDLDNIIELCNQYNIIVIEDNANSPFSTYNNRSTGIIGDIGLWSFDAMKILVTGDGGMIYAKDQSHIDKFKSNIYLGMQVKSGYSNTVNTKWWEFDIDRPGRRSIINDVQAAIGIEQLKKVKQFIKRRKQIHEKYSDKLNTLDEILCPLPIPRNKQSSYYMYHIQLDTQEVRDNLAKYLKKNGVYTTFRYYPLHQVKYFSCNDVLPNTCKAAETTLCIPLHQSLTDAEVDTVINLITNYFK